MQSDLKIIYSVKMLFTQERAKLVWGDEDLSCLSLATGASAMHKLRWIFRNETYFFGFFSSTRYFTIHPPFLEHLQSENNGVQLWLFWGRPQPSWDRTCTAAAAAALLSELHLLPQFSSYGLDEQVEALEDALLLLLEALTARRTRMGRSITRKVRRPSNIC